MLVPKLIPLVEVYSKSPPARAVGIDEHVQAPLIGQLVGLLTRFGGVNRQITQHGVTPFAPGELPRKLSLHAQLLSTDTPRRKHTEMDLKTSALLISADLDGSPPTLSNGAAAAYADSIKQEYGALAGKVLAVYPAASDAVAKHSQLALMRDDWFAWHMWTWARLQSTTGRGKVYFYNFSYVPNWPPDSPLTAMAAAHGFELGDVFAHADLLPPTATAKNKRVMETIFSYWTNFAKFGNPNGPGLPEWPTFTGDRQRIMKLVDPIEAGKIPAEDLRGIKFLG